MLSNTVQANFRISSDVMEELRRLLSRGQQSEFVQIAIARALKRLKFEKAINTSFGAWSKNTKTKNVGKFIRGLRQGRKF